MQFRLQLFFGIVLLVLLESFTLLVAQVTVERSTSSGIGCAEVIDIDNESQFDEIKKIMESDFPFLHIRRFDVSGEVTLATERGGMCIFCIYQGAGEIFLPRGYRTQEGDGTALPENLYTPDPIDREFSKVAAIIQTGLDSISAKALPAVRSILARLSPDKFCGDITGDLWRLLEQAPRPWATDLMVENAIQSLFLCYREQGFSTKIEDSWEKIMAGDQLIVCQDEKLLVRGSFSCFSIEHIERKTSHISSVRRLRFLRDTAGGCSPGFDPFRRLPTTWFSNYPNETNDGLNFFNNHVVNIPAENSPTHFHPPVPIGGGMAQTEFYLVLDPKEYNLSTAGEESFITLYPDLNDLSQFATYSLQPGMFVYMPPGTGHRGQNVFALIMAIPGFKPGNELYLDHDIFERTEGKSPYNPNHLPSKNYQKLEDFIDKPSETK